MEGGNPFRLIDLLTEHNVPAVVIGGHAVSFHGYMRATEDTDVVFLRTAASEQALFDAPSPVSSPPQSAARRGEETADSYFPPNA